MTITTSRDNQSPTTRAHYTRGRAREEETGFGFDRGGGAS